MGGHGYYQAGDPRLLNDGLAADNTVKPALVARAAGRDQNVQRELTARYSPTVVAICNRTPLSSHDVEDLNLSVRRRW
jgi:hypothetical protein